jgi:hypothetical protein
MKDHRASTARYLERLDLLAKVLYARDPYSMGASIGAPEDEYVPIAERLMPLLGKATTREEFAQLLSVQDMDDERLADDVWQIFAEHSM